MYKAFKQVKQRRETGNYAAAKWKWYLRRGHSWWRTSGFYFGLYPKQGRFEVIIVDKARFPKQKLCAGLLTQETICLICSLFNETVCSLLKKGIIDFESDYFEVFFRNRRMAKVHHKSLPFYCVKRSLYDNFSLKKAKGKVLKFLKVKLLFLRITAKLKLWRQVARLFIRNISLEPMASTVELEKKCFSRAKILICCATWFSYSFWSGCWKKVINADYFPKIFYGYVKWGYAWLFPNKDRLKIGLGGLNGKNRKTLLSSFRAFLSALGLSNYAEKRIQGHAVPYCNFLEKPVRESTLLVGDAAGFADPLLGEGIYYAHKSAQLASFAIIQEKVEGENPGGNT